MALDDYKQKRDFDKTPEPQGVIRHTNSKRFVIQRHQARRLHYDLRLEMLGVLKSWAVPKGPSMNPTDKRLAIRTEDHPVEYLHFYGTIPKGNYGAGEMQIWDEGFYKTNDSKEEIDAINQLENGSLKIEFFGKKIKGSFALVQIKHGKEKNNWLLIKKKDIFSTDLMYDSEEVNEPPIKEDFTKIKTLNTPRFIKPMLASPTKKIFKDAEWLFELKWDGYRMVSSLHDQVVALYSRNGRSYNEKFPSLVKELKQVSIDCILDGEVVLIDENGKVNFQELQKYNFLETKGELKYYVFDLLQLNGIDTISLPLKERKSLLLEVLENLQSILYCEHIEGMGPTLYKRALDAGMEGVVAKKANSEYVPGYRSENWLKIKPINTEEAIICGYTDSITGGRIFGSLILGMYQDKELIYVGNCGSGFSVAEQEELINRFKKYTIVKSPFNTDINLKGRTPHWLTPSLICEIKFLEWTKNGKMRHPVYLGIRKDKNKNEVVMQEEKKNIPSQNKNSSSIEIDGVPVAISNLKKVFWPNAGYTKYDLIDYYLHIAEYLLPYLKDRPQNLHRHPNGINKPSFYQKNQETLPTWIETFSIYSKSSKKDIDYLLCQNEATLLYMVNLGCIEINPWNSTINNIDQPTYTVIDLDPSPKNTFEEVIEVALAVKEVLDLAKIKAYPKTSGSSGIHIYIPLNSQYSFEEARDFTKLLCYYVKEQLPRLTTMDRSLSKRKDRIYLDYLQNRRGQTLAAPYCVRPKNDAPVSTPLLWKEVKPGLEIRDFTIKNMQARVKKVGDLYLPVLGEGIDMEAALDNLT